MYRVLDLEMSDRDFESLLSNYTKYEEGRIALADFKRFARRLMKKYNKPASDIYRYGYAALMGNYTYIPSFRLIRATLRFKRPIREPFNWKHYNYHPIQVIVFTISNKWTRDDVEAVSREIIDELVSEWNKPGGTVEFDEEHSIYDPPEVLEKRDGFTEDKYNKLRKYLGEYDWVARDPRNWINYTPPSDFRNEDHILSHYIACGLDKYREVTAESNLLDLLMSECPCEEGSDFPVSESLTVYASNTIGQRCILWKKSGWRRPKGAKRVDNKYVGGKPTSFVYRRKKRKEGKKEITEEEEEEEEEELPKRWKNPLARYNIYHADKKFWNTLIICKRYGLNPVPLRPNNKLPAIEWRYLLREPIRPEHFEMFKNPDYNIGIMAGYNNIMIVDLDVPIRFNITTLTDRSPRGYHYYFKVDKVLKNISFMIREGKCAGKSPLGIIGRRYVAAPPSTVDGKEYKWVYIEHLLTVRSASLVKVFEDYFNNNYDKIKRLFEPHCRANEV